MINNFTMIPRFVVYVIAAIFIIALIIVSLLPWGVEYYIEENDVEMLGREVEMEDIDFNPFTGYLEIAPFELFEAENDQVFMSADRVEGNLAMLSLFSFLPEWEWLRIKNLEVVIIQEHASFNFDDLLTRLSDEGDSMQVEEGEASPYLIHNVSLENGTLIYRDLVVGSELTLEQIAISIPEITHDFPGMDYLVELRQKQGGEIKVKGKVNWEHSLNSNSIHMDNWTLRPYKNYLNAFLNIQDFDAQVFADLEFGANYSDSGFVAVSGSAGIRDFFLVNMQSDSLLGFSSAGIHLDSVNTSEHMYDVQRIEMEEPSILFKYFESSNSFSELYVDASEEVLDTISVNQQEIVFENPFQYVSEYLFQFLDEDVLNSFQLDSVTLTGGSVVFQDYSGLEDAVITVEDFSARANSISRDDTVLVLEFESRLNQSGELLGELIFDRQEFSNYDFTFDIQDFYISAFDPYSKHYTAYPLWEGQFNVTSRAKVNKNHLESENRILIVQPEVGKKLDREAEYNIPLRFAFGLLKDVEGNIDLDVPIEGDLDDPDYKLGPVILKVFMNLLSKAVASPYKLLARTFDADEEDMKAVRFGVDQDSLDAPQEKALNLLARVLENKQDLKATLEYILNEEEERDQVALRYAKQEFRLQLAESLRQNYPSIDAVDNADSLFGDFLNQKTGGLGTSSVAQMSRTIMGDELLDNRIDEIREMHHQLVQDYLFETRMLESERITIIDSEESEKLNAVIRPTFHIHYEALDYTASDSISGPAPPSEKLIAPTTDSSD